MKILKMAFRIIIVSVVIISISYFVSSSIAHYFHPQRIDAVLTESGDAFSMSRYQYEQSFSRIFALMTPALTIIYSSIYLVLRKRYYKKYESKK